MAKFEPLASKTYNLIFEYNEPRYQEACEKMITKNGVQKLMKFSESWSCGVYVDGGTEMVYWNIYDPQVVETIKSMGLLKGIPIQVTVAQEMGEKHKPYNTYQFVKDNQSYYSQLTGIPATEQPQNYATAEVLPETKYSVEEELDKRKRLMKWCIDTVLEVLPTDEWYKQTNTPLPEDKTVRLADVVPLIQSLHVEIRDKGIYPPKEMSDEEIKAKYEEGNMSLPEAQNIHGQPPPPTDEDAPF